MSYLQNVANNVLLVTKCIAFMEADSCECSDFTYFNTWKYCTGNILLDIIYVHHC